MTVLTDRYEGRRYNQPNDLALDSPGRIYFTDPRYGSREGMEILDQQGRTIEGVYRIDLDGKVTRIIGRELERPNGILVSADDRFLFVADNNNDTLGGARSLWCFALNPGGSVDLDSRKLVYDWGNGRGPDGFKEDQAGFTSSVPTACHTCSYHAANGRTIINRPTRLTGSITPRWPISASFS